MVDYFKVPVNRNPLLFLLFYVFLRPSGFCLSVLLLGVSKGDDLNTLFHMFGSCE